MSFDEIFDLTAGVYFNFYNMSAGSTFFTRTMGVLELLLLLCPAIRWHTPQASPRADGIG